MKKLWDMWNGVSLSLKKEWNLVTCCDVILSQQGCTLGTYTKGNKVKSLSSVWLFATPWTVTYQAPPSTGFSRQGYWIGLPFPSPGESSQPRDRTQVSCVAGRCFTLWATREATLKWNRQVTKSQILCYSTFMRYLKWSKFPRRLNDKEHICQCSRHRLDLWVRKIPWRREWQPIPVFLPGESHGQRSLKGSKSPWGCRELDTTEWLKNNKQSNHSNRKNVGCQRLEKGNNGKFIMSIELILQDKKKLWRLFVQKYN